MRKSLVSLFMVFMVYSGSAFSAIISLLPSSQTINASGIATVDLLISGLGDFTSPSLGAFDVEVTFDNSILSFNSETFGTMLGVSIQGVDTSTAGVVRLDETSWESVATLDGLQPDSFLLATLTFHGRTRGSSPLRFGDVILSDAFGNVIVDPTLIPASVNVVPVPAAIWLFAGALCGLVGIARKKAE